MNMNVAEITRHQELCDEIDGYYGLYEKYSDAIGCLVLVEDINYRLIKSLAFIFPDLNFHDSISIDHSGYNEHYNKLIEIISKYTTQYVQDEVNFNLIEYIVSEMTIEEKAICTDSIFEIHDIVCEQYFTKHSEI